MVKRESSSPDPSRSQSLSASIQTLVAAYYPFFYSVKKGLASLTEKHHEVFICTPCKSDHHMECESTKEKPCDCIVCLGEEIGDQVVGDWSPRRRRAQRL